jgi:dynein heavy chain
MIYIDSSELGWRTYVESWSQTKFPNKADEEIKLMHRDLFEKWVPKVLKFKEENCFEPVKISDFNAVSTLCALYDAIQKEESNFSKQFLGENFNSAAEKIFVFALAWSVGAAVDEVGRRKLNTCLSDIDSILPPANTVYDYYVDLTKNEFVSWESKVPTWRYAKGMTFHDMIIPTIDKLRNSYIIDTFIKFKKNVCVVGATGTGKTVLAQSVLRNLPANYSQLKVNFSAATTSVTVQDIIEAPMEKKSKDKLGPIGGKTLVIFIDGIKLYLVIFFFHMHTF